MKDPVQTLLERTLDSAEPFPTDSRYHGIPTARFLAPSGRAIRYVGRRFTPPGADQAAVAEHVVARGDRHDSIAARYLGNPETFWRICDANDAVRPSDLVATPGRRLRIALPPGVPGPTP
jgi:nucleoid-associated protein YgaU